MKRFWVAVPVLIFAGLLLHRPTPAPALVSVPAPAHAGPARRARVAPTPLVVYVAGAVRHRGLYRLPDGSRAADAVARAGGMDAAADADAIDLAAPVADGEEVRVPRRGDPSPRARRATHSSVRRARTHRKTPVGKVDLNTADAQTIASLPGIGILLAQRIVAYRRLNGPFSSTDELADVAGLTERRVDAVVPYLRL